MEGSDGSSRKLKLDSTGGATQEKRAWLSERLDDHDDPLLDLSDDRETQQTESRLLLDFESTDDAAERLPRKDFPTESGIVSSELISRDYQTAATAATVKQLGGDISHGPGGLATEGPVLAWSDSASQGGVDYFGSGDPTFLNTNLPSFPVVPPRLSEMDVHTDSGPAFSDTSHAVCESSPLRSSSLTTSAALLSAPPPHTQQGFPPWKGGGTRLNRRSDAAAAAASDGVGPVNKTERGLPDVATRQPLLPLPQTRSRYQPHLTHPATTAAQGETLTVARASSSSSSSSATHTEAPSSPVSGFVIDYSHNAAMGDGKQMTHACGNSNVQGDFPQNVMLASFPTPSSRETGVGVVTEDRGYGAFTLETHCHSATNRHSMDDSLARQQLLIVLVLCVLFMIGETVGEWSFELLLLCYMISFLIKNLLSSFETFVVYFIESFFFSSFFLFLCLSRALWYTVL